MAVATLGYHVLTDEWLVIGWECSYPGRLSIAESRNVLRTHDIHGKSCRIRRTAKRVLARLIDAPTVRAQAFAPTALTFDPPPPLTLTLEYARTAPRPDRGRAGSGHYVAHLDGRPAREAAPPQPADN
jgi:hypothetical protein